MPRLRLIYDDFLPHPSRVQLKPMQFKGYTLSPFQVQAAKALSSGHNVLVSAPTGAGKTLVAEYAIAEAIANRRKVIYTSPIKALSNQKYRDFKEDGLDVGLSTGDLTLHADAQVVIMTTEIFRNAVFEDPERFHDLDYVIYDEIHFLDDLERGTVWEESLIFAPPHVRFVGLSATIANLEQFGGWLSEIREHELEIIRYDTRPVPLSHHLYHSDVGLFNLAQRKKAMQTAKLRSQKERGQSRQGKSFDGKGDRKGGDRKKSRFRDRRRRPHASALLLDVLCEDHKTPILFFCFSRKECEIKAERNMRRSLLNHKQREQMTDLFLDTCEKFEINPDKDPILLAIEQRARNGIGFHHAGMLPIHKEIVERMFTSGLLRLLFTTETFALGINMPARTVCFDSLRKFDGVNFDYMSARDYMQMAGRAGRQGIDKEGTVISIVDDEALRDAPLPKLFGGQVEPVTSRFNLSYSTIINLYEHMGSNLLDAYDRSFAAYQAQTGNKKNRDRQRSQARNALRARMRVLIEAGYLDKTEDDKPVLLPRGKIAQQINGYEIQVTELLLDGILDDLDAHELSACFTALIYSARRGVDSEPGRRYFGHKLAHRAETAIQRFAAFEALQGFTTTIKPPDWALTGAVVEWSHGCDIEEMERIAGTTGGDIVRTMRMAIQMLRQLRSSLSGDYPLIPRIEEAIVRINRSEVDAKRQFELG